MNEGMWRMGRGKYLLMHFTDEPNMILNVEVRKFGRVIHQECLKVDENPELKDLWDFRQECWDSSEAALFVNAIEQTILESAGAR